MVIKQLEEIKAIERFHIWWVSGVFECLFEIVANNQKLSPAGYLSLEGCCCVHKMRKKIIPARNVRSRELSELFGFFSSAADCCR